jgi:hypothetical protein
MKKEKKKKNLVRQLFLAALAFFILGIAGVEIIQSDWAKEKARLFLVKTLNESGFDVKIEKIEGSLPQFIRIEGISIQGKGIDVSVRILEARLSLIRLLKKEIAFTSLNAEGIAWKTASPPKAGQETSTLVSTLAPRAIALPKLPVAIYVEQFQAKDVAVAPSILADFEGRLRLSKRKSFIHIRGKRQGFPESSARLFAIVKEDGLTQIRTNLKTPTLALFFPVLPEKKGEMDADLKLELVATGPLSSFFKEGPNPVRGKISGTIIPRSLALPVPIKEWVERTWKINIGFVKDQTLELSKISAKTDLFSIKGKSSFDSSFHFSEGDLQLVSEQLFSSLPFTSSGRFLAQAKLKKEAEALKIEGVWKVPSLTVDGYRAEQVKGGGSAVWQKDGLTGAFQTQATFLSAPWEGKTAFSWKPKGSVFLTEMGLKAPYLTGKGNLELRSDFLLEGKTEIEIENLQSLKIPGIDLFGSLKIRGEWKPIVDPETSLQGLYLDLSASDVYWGSFYAHKAFLYSDLIDPFHTLYGNIDLSLEQTRWGHLQFASVVFETAAKTGIRPFSLSAEGKWKHPLDFRMDGSWSLENNDFNALIRTWSGSYSSHPFAMKESVNLEISPSLFRLKNLGFSLGNAEIAAFIDRQNENTEAGLKLVHVPLDFLSITPLDFPIAGQINLEANLQEKNNRLKGDLKATIEKIEREETQLPENEKLNATGAFIGSFDRNRLELKGNLQARDTPLLDIDLSLPIHLSIWPFQAELLYYMNAKGHVGLKGRIEDFLDFFDLGSHRLEGDCQCDIRFSNTLNRPNLSGFCSFKNGFYQNYYSGTELKDITADWQAEKDTLYLRSLTAQDAPGKGSFTAQGQIAVRPEDLFPFRFDVEFSHLNFVQIDLVTAEANGKIHIEGNRTSAVAKGSIDVVNSELTIPDHIARTLPDLQVTYKNATHPVAPPDAIVYKPYPLFLDLHVATPEKIVIAGKGLHSQWMGDFDIGGTYSSITAKGNLELSTGEFVFAGRTFKLSEGSLSFSGKEHEMPYLNIAGSIDQKGVKVTARMKGPLNNPQITFQSVPPLPLSSIMSYLLFGQNIGEITGFQALQLATSIASLAGQGPDILESTRKALGVDRLRIIANPTEEGGETIAIQVGTYVTEGVIVSFSQGAEDSSSNISIEVEIKDNFSFQAETQQQTEQGKFSLKWYVNY